MEDTKSPDSEGKADRFRVMELRSGRRVRRSPPPRRVRSRRAPCGGADDRLSALPDDMLLLVLACLRRARSAARTSILSRCWRDLWTCLPDLTFRDVAPAKIEAVLARLASSPSVPAMLDIEIPPTYCADDGRLSQLLDSVVRFSQRELIFGYLFGMYLEADLPCFPRATSIEFNCNNNICFTQLPADEFSALEKLSLGGASIIDVDTLVTRCPRLRMLSVSVSTSDIKVHSLSLQTLRVSGYLVCISNIDMLTPMLKQLKLDIQTDTDLSVSISAPMLKKVEWFRSFREMNLLFGFWYLESTDMRTADSFGPGGGDYWRNEDSSAHHLCLLIVASEVDLAQEVEFAQEMEKLLVIDFSVLDLTLLTRGHVFGALMWRLLGWHQICAATKRLLVHLSSWYPEREACPANCPCDEPKNWRCQSISLMCLEEVHIDGFTGDDHECDFLKLIFRSSPMLSKVSLKLELEFGGCTKKIYNTFLAYPDVEGYVYLVSGELVPPPSDYLACL
ncbi:putative F-box/FBD/LRR-repeat protein At1g22000 [Triticum urartu]|uniref:putative F-box/FBD/LRR-repeat protein At1g22000 n=1 Tax=Triticum urartu TaxID=4572 RepID=UPI0020437B38|nr:putative F-box/FBD/LRR-repeat protein At1g22000 [Triticum urartu]